MSEVPNIERHPLQPFLPDNARLLMLGSFPPPKERWCMPFFYPNPQNDMWRIIGMVFFDDKMHFVEQKQKTSFRYEEIAAFCSEKGIAIFDTAQAVRRLQGNAADEHLEIIEPTDIAALLKQIPLCHDICCTGGKATETLFATMQITTPPKTGEFAETEYAARRLRVWRMPSTSRAYPLSLERKSAAYSKMFYYVFYQR
jgi:G:T/U-mismatch repair DNA glycosylase